MHDLSHLNLVLGISIELLEQMGLFGSGTGCCAVLLMEVEGVGEAWAQVVDAIGVRAVEFGELFGDDFDGQVLKL